MSGLPERIQKRLAVAESGCWIWSGTTVKGGYGRARMGGKSKMLHRLVYEFLKGPIPDGLTLDHLCRTPACANPDHLEPVTMRENLLRGDSLQAINARKTGCSRGHSYEGNLYIDPRGRRECRLCRRDADRRAQAKLRVV